MYFLKNKLNRPHNNHGALKLKEVKARKVVGYCVCEIFKVIGTVNEGR